MFIRKAQAEDLIKKIEAAEENLPEGNKATILGLRDILKNELDQKNDIIKVNKRAFTMVQAAVKNVKSAKPTAKKEIPLAIKELPKPKEVVRAEAKAKAKEVSKQLTAAQKKAARNMRQLLNRPVGDPRNPRG